MMNTALFLAAVVLTSLNLGRALPIRRQTPPQESNKFVVAHFMVGNTFPYKRNLARRRQTSFGKWHRCVCSQRWFRRLAKGQSDDAFNAAEESGTGFKMFMSFDMSVNPCAGPADAAPLREYITKYASHPAQFKFNGKVFASTFAGESCTFGAATPEQGWKQQFTDQLTGENAAMFIQELAAMDGAFNWNGGWPTQISASKLSETISFLNSNPSNPSAAPIPVPASLTPIANVVSPLAAPSLVSKRTHDKRAASDVASKLAAALAGSINLDSDRTIASNLGTSGASGAGNVYMSSVSPWFYTHYGPDSFNKNWIFRSDDWLYNTRWDQLIQGRNGIDIVQIISWNDYGESHYIGPIEGAQPNSNAWVDGFDHQAWLEMTSYYATAFKTGQYPAITKDQVFLSARPHPAKAMPTEDNLWAVVFATQPGKLTLSADPSKPQSFDIPAGVSKLQIPLIPGQGITATLTRNGATVVDMKPDFTFNPNPETYNYNAATFIGSAE
ncbi:alpha-1,3-glucanase [Ceratobasidium sp. AG-Ba]|nr:alpha-1,3-glucanase [Ceratobasidium sp. AG-Ba]